MESRLLKELDPLFHPASVAHVGASGKEALGRFNYTEFLVKMKFPGKIYPVNPKYQEVFGLKCYAALKDVPGTLDLVYICVPATACIEILKDCPPHKIKFAVIHTSGYKEIGKTDLEQELLAEARLKGIRLIGPNCMGIFSQEARIGFWRSHHEIVDFPGTVGFVSQSGGHAVDLLWGGSDSYIFFNKAVSLGNQIDLSINEVVEYMGADPAIGVVGIYVEDIRDGRKFLEVVKRISREKPVVVFKGGTTARGKAAAVTHTGSLAGNEKVFAAALGQAGGILVHSQTELRRLLRLLQPPFRLPGSRLAIISPGGGNTVNICDHFSSQPIFSIPRLTPETESYLRSILPAENIDVANPVDPGAVGFGRLNELLDAVAQDPNIDTLLFLIGPEFLGEIPDPEIRANASRMFAQVFGYVNKGSGKPMIVLLRHLRENHELYDNYRRIMLKDFHDAQVPWVDGGNADMASAIAKVVRYKIYRDQRQDSRS